MAKKPSRWSRTQCRKSNIEDFLYSMPNSKLLTLLIIVTIVMVIIFFYLFKYATKNWKAINSENNATVGTYLSIIGVPIGITLSFIVAAVWGFFQDAQTKQVEEARSLLLLYNIVGKSNIQGSDAIQEQIREYTERIIVTEFPIMEEGKSSTEGLVLLLQLGDSITALQPANPREVALYTQSIDIYKQLVDDRVTRYSYVLYGLAPELWWVLVLGVVLIIVLSFFFFCTSLVLHCVCVCIAAVGLTSLLFLIVALNYPYRGDFGIDSNSYKLVLARMN